MLNQDEKLVEGAVEFIRRNKKLLIERFASDKIFLPDSAPVSVFMAGSPGAGKTEISKELLKLYEETQDQKNIRIDADEIRDIIPGYTGQNSYLFQKAASRGVDVLHNHALKNNKNFILDGTFSNYNIVCQNIERSIKRERRVSITYVYQDPLIAWEFTQKREKTEGRKVPKGTFIEKLFLAKENVEKIKEKFGERVELDIVKKNFDHNIKKG